MLGKPRLVNLNEQVEILYALSPFRQGIEDHQANRVGNYPELLSPVSPHSRGVAIARRFLFGFSSHRSTSLLDTVYDILSYAYMPKIIYNYILMSINF
jgi:hypothetical protein